MPLDKSSTDYLGKNLFVLPFYGNGWIRENVSSEPWEKIEMIGPKSFQLLVQDFLEFDNQLIGVRGIIVQKEHQYDGYHCLACLRMTGEYNVVDKPGHYMIWIARNEVHFSPAAEKAVYEYVIQISLHSACVATGQLPILRAGSSAMLKWRKIPEGQSKMRGIRQSEQRTPTNTGRAPVLRPWLDHD